MARKKRKRDPSAPQARGASMADLPTAIFFEIVLKLSTWSIVMSKSVCRAWRDLISDPRFAKLHFAQATPCPLLRNRLAGCFARALYLLEPDDGKDFGAGYCWCDSSEGPREGCCPKVKVKCMLKIPIRNAHSMLSCVDIGNTVFSTNERYGIQASVKVTSRIYDHTYGSVTSCNGFLCILDPDNESECVICNPITGEFIHVPKPPNKERSGYDHVSIILGFNPKGDQYKVLHVFPIDHRSDFAAEIHTLGTTSWRSLGVFAWKLNVWYSPVYFNGAIHWLCYGDNKSYLDCIACFDLDEEQFRSCSIPLPLSLRDNRNPRNHLTISVIGGRLCVTLLSTDLPMHIWAMDVYSAAESWTKLVLIDFSISPPCEPFSRLSDGAFLLFANRNNKLIYRDESGEFKYKRVTTRLMQVL